MCQSPLLTAAARTRTSTSSSLTIGLPTSRIPRTAGEPYLFWMIALTGFSSPSPKCARSEDSDPADAHGCSTVSIRKPERALVTFPRDSDLLEMRDLEGCTPTNEPLRR